MSRRWSHKRTTTYVRLISSISPNSPSTTTWSVTRTGCATENWMPPMIPANDFCAANPTTTPTTPADASSDTPTLRTTSNCMRTIEPARNTTAMLATGEGVVALAGGSLVEEQRPDAQRAQQQPRQAKDERRVRHVLASDDDGARELQPVNERAIE